MIKKRKKTLLDGMDKSILRTIGGSKRSLTGNQISQKVNLSPGSLKLRLDNMKLKGILKNTRIDKTRSFTRLVGNKKVKIKAPRNIFWDIDLIKKRKIK